MKILTQSTIAGALLISISIIVLADNPVALESYHGDPQRGAKIAAWGTSNGVASCLSCHGYDGVGNGTSVVPRLAESNRRLSLAMVVVRPPADAITCT